MPITHAPGLTLPTAPAALVQTYATADRTHSAPVTTAAATSAAVTASTNVTPYGYSTLQQANDVRAGVNDHATRINTLVTDLADVKQLLNSLIDDLQALGLVG